MLERRLVQHEGELRAEQQRLPAGQLRAHRLDVVVVHAVAVVAQVAVLDRVHRAHHERGEQEHEPLVAALGDADRVVEGVVDLAQPAQEEHERAGERRDEPEHVRVRPEVREHQRREQPGRVDQHLVQHVPLAQIAEVLPLHRREPRVAQDLERHVPLLERRCATRSAV
jgi:hypothetical protein